MNRSTAEEFDSAPRFSRATRACVDPARPPHAMCVCARDMSTHAEPNAHPPGAVRPLPSLCARVHELFMSNVASLFRTTPDLFDILCP
eukprot:5617093-Pyramimonas_sp.AAC.1